MSRTHGGPDARGVARWDFSTNANAAGPCPLALEALRRADPSRYPDPAYHRLREQLAGWHGVEVSRIVIAASASEFIQRITAVGARLAPGPVQVPRHAYGDYAAAAQAHGRAVVTKGQDDELAPTLRWCADPSSPLGQDSPPPADLKLCTTVLDAVYAPLRLEGSSAWGGAARDAVFQLVSPNKALGLPGVRAAYAISPNGGGDIALWATALAATEPSWPLGADGVALLEAWVGDGAQQWLAEQRPRLRQWKRTLVQLLLAAGAEVQPSVTPFVCARLPAGVTPQTLRTCGIAVRNAGSFGLSGWVRLSAQPPASMDALRQALHERPDDPTLLTTES
ncbi:aminotransferase class I/II-fold pyridoxal phosphate-dependent enzyme [Ideonella sp. YS5]|uniref:aminotransferase class I/II-fold pyridoxal phosphate-dependent enzyme n=1 Tax=Ideonella sp. YS5 TaxID=3453714 RepID=UPI003EE9106C